jgi:membrane protease YdiL (CAAX protease family)
VSTRWAVLATALPFALFHVFLQPIPLLVPLFILGIVLAVVVERTRSLYPAIILHSTYNLIIGSLNVIPALVA